MLKWASKITFTFSVLDLNGICMERCDAVLLQCIAECPADDTSCWSDCIRDGNECTNGKFSFDQFYDKLL